MVVSQKSKNPLWGVLKKCVLGHFSVTVCSPSSQGTQHLSCHSSSAWWPWGSLDTATVLGWKREMNKGLLSSPQRLFSLFLFIIGPTRFLSKIPFLILTLCFKESWFFFYHVFQQPCSLKKMQHPLGKKKWGICMWFNSRLLLSLSDIKFQYISVLC